MDPRIADYITANRRKYTRQAIRQQLIDAGHDPAEVDRTWAALGAKDPDAVIGDRFWARFALIVVGINVAVFLLVAALTGMVAHIGAGALVLPVIFAVILGVGALIAWGIVALTGPDKMGSTTALTVGISVPLLFALLIGGSCYALVGTLSGLGGPPPRTGPMELQLGEPIGATGSGTANCFSSGDSFNVFGLVSAEDGQQIDVSVDSFVDGGGRPTSVSVALLPTDPNQVPRTYASNADDSRVTLDATADGLSGSVSFEGLRADQGVEGKPEQPMPSPGGELLSGTLTWACE